MIEVENINGSPAHIPNNVVGQHFNGEYFIFFESEQEKTDFYNSLKVFSLDAHKREIEAATDDHVNKVVRVDYWYKNEGELSIRSTKENRHKNEATALSLWVIVVYDALEDYLNEVSEETHLSVEDFINSLPQPNV